MRKILIFCFIILISFTACEGKKDKTVFLTILARNKGSFLPRYLRCIDNLDYDKRQITVYINTNNNEDDTEELLKAWVEDNEKKYAEILFESHHIENLSGSNPHEWTAERFSSLAEIRNHSLDLAKQSKCDYYFVVDCDNFIASSTLKTLMKHEKPIIAPMLQPIPESGDQYSNFFYDITDSGYYQDHPNYSRIFHQTMIGVFEVPVAHCTYLIQSQYFDNLSYTDGTDDYEFVIFSRIARNAGIKQYICNEKDFGVLLHFHDNVSLQEERDKVGNIMRLQPM